MKRKSNFKQEASAVLQENKRVVLYLMIAFLLLGLIKIFYERTIRTNVNQDGSLLNKIDTVTNKFKNENSSDVDYIDIIDLENSMKTLDSLDSLKLKETNEKLNNIIIK